MLKRKGLAAAALVAATLLPGFGALTHPAAASSRIGTITQNTDMFIYDPTGARLLGRAHYTVTQHDDLVTIEGRNDFIDGQRDLEHDTLRAVDSGVPRMLTYQHDFFDEHGAPQITASADAVSGKSSCGKYEDGKGTIETAVLQYPPDTYAGAGVLVPVADHLRRGGTELDIHVFDCALGPRILTLHADLTRETWRFRPHDGELARAEAHPVFGWFNVFLKPFVPTIRMWFDPLRDYVFVGGMLSRYYRGPEVLLVSTRTAPKSPPAFERPEPPSLTAPTDSAPPAEPSGAADGSTPSSASAAGPEHPAGAPVEGSITR